MKNALQNLYVEKFFNIDRYKNVEPFVINRVLSMNTNNLSVCAKIDKYTFHINRKLFFALAHSKIVKGSSIQWRKYIKPLVDEKNEFDFLFIFIKKYYNWSEKDLKDNKNILLEMFKDKEKLRYFFRFFGIDKKIYKKYDIEFVKKKRWF